LQTASLENTMGETNPLHYLATRKKLTLLG